jgi:hypothetical protein
MDDFTQFLKELVTTLIFLVIITVLITFITGCETLGPPKITLYRFPVCIDGVEYLRVYELNGTNSYLVPHYRENGSLYKCYE